MGKSGLDSVVCSDLLSQDGQRVVAWRVTAMVATRTVSISMTVLNAFSESPEIRARKLPAAPRVKIKTINRPGASQKPEPGAPQVTKVNSSKSCDSLLDRLFQLRRLANISGRGNAATTRQLFHFHFLRSSVKALCVSSDNDRVRSMFQLWVRMNIEESTLRKRDRLMMASVGVRHIYS